MKGAKQYKKEGEKQNKKLQNLYLKKDIFVIKIVTKEL